MRIKFKESLNIHKENLKGLRKKKLFYSKLKTPISPSSLERIIKYPL